MDSKLLER